MEVYSTVFTRLLPLLVMVNSVQGGDVDVYYLHISSDITYRYSNTQVVSRMANRGDNATEATFLIQLPDSAFISNFSMEVDGRLYKTMIKEKEEAKQIYEKAKKWGKSAAHVSQRSRKARIFQVAVNVAAKTKVTFSLVYQELLQRTRGVYEHVIYINPGQPVKNMSVDININELKKITFLKVLPLQPIDAYFDNSIISTPTDNSTTLIRRPTPTSARITYRPSFPHQSAEGGISGKFTVQYDVQRAFNGGEIYLVDGYFVHYFSPSLSEGAAPNKNIVFVLDRSGSMGGQKMRQLKDAMGTILSQLRFGDYFNIITFSDDIEKMEHDPLIKVDAQSLTRAHRFMRRVHANGGTNIHSAVLKGLKLLYQLKRRENGGDRPSLLVFLTDGEPTEGIKDDDTIVRDIVAANTDQTAVFSLGFGDDVRFDFLKKISLSNHGFARKIYQAADAALQLKHFYKEVGTPLLYGLDIQYLNDSVVDVTRTDYKLLFKGSEIVIAGKIGRYHSDIISQIQAVTGKGSVAMIATATVSTPPGGLRGVTERLWAYLSIQQLLDAMLEETDSARREVLKDRALQLSLKYHFVTPFTSMVVVNPQDESYKDSVALCASNVPRDCYPEAKDINVKRNMHHQVNAKAPGSYVYSLHGRSASVGAIQPGSPQCAGTFVMTVIFNFISIMLM